MATAYAQPPSSLQSPRQQYLQPTPQSQRRHASRRKFAAEFSQCLYEFVIQLLPTPEELMVKEDVRKLLEQLIRTIEPDSRLLSFGSTANGFSLRNSDMDLCCLIDSEEKLAASDLVNMLGDLLERETKFHVKPLPHARIPIVKLSLDPAPGLPLGIACDIGFENRLALENTRLLMCYAMIDPARVRTMVLFLKVWSKRRKINSPYKGTLSSYGYVLLVIYFLVHVKNPPVLPNLQQMPPLRSISHEDTHLNGHNIWFFDDIELLRQRWKSSNTESVAELLIDFFKFYSRDFTYSTGVASIRAGLLSKDSKGWANEFDKGDPRERNRLCIEDPFETDYNVARCVTRDGLYTVRGEFMRASRILAACPDRAVVAISELCEERLDEELLHPSPPRGAFVPPRLSPLPPQIPYTIGSSPMRPISLPVADQLTASEKTSANGTFPPSISSIPSSPPQPPSVSSGCAEIQNPLPIEQLEHMAPKRSKWTSPPPPEAPEEDRSAFEQRLGQSLALATVASAARERERHTAPSVSSSAASEVPTDDEARSDIAESDDVHSVQSFTEEGTLSRRREKETEADREPTVTLERQQSRQMRPDSMYCVQDPSSSCQAVRQENTLDAKTLAKLRGRAALKWPQTSDTNYKPQLVDKQATYVLPPRTDTPRTPRRSLSGPARTPLSNRFSQMAIPPFVPGPPYFTPDLSTSRQAPPHLSNVNVYYETTPSKDKMYRVLPYAFPMSPVSPVSPQQQYDVPTYYEIARSLNGSPSSSPRHTFAAPQQDMPSSRQPAPRHLPPSLHRNSRPIVQVGAGSSSLHVGDARLSLSPGGYSHSHSHSTATVTSATTPRAHVQDFGPAQLPSPSLSRSHSPPDLQREPQQRLKAQQHVPPLLSGEFGAKLPSSSASVSSESASPPMSSTSSQYAASCSPLSTSPPSPTHSDAFGKQQSRVHDSPRQSGRGAPQTTPAGRGTGDGHGMTVVTGQRGPTHARDVMPAQVGATRSHGNVR